ncbi:class I SAM-dependent methyltransferase [Sinomonas gamaensis]|uniref:class I SAM-dependent methyltransferase n=1 Tax=Sinomonas gamaensis TaxID=2565624 RepID=UPI001487240A|nr:class I SAM-dependent methyltransferase [Sinomonas gamaensis]
MHAFWSLYATVYDAIWASPLTEALAAAAETHTGHASTVVDLGCGTGLMTSRQRAHVLGVDRSPAMLRRAIQRNRIDQGLLVGRIEATGLPSASAECVLLCNVLHLHPDPRAVLREAKRLCRPDGIIFVCWPLDGIDALSVYRIDRSLGRALISAKTAHTLRGLIGIAAAFTGTQRYAGEAVEQAIFGSSEIEILRDQMMANCQRIVVIRRQSPPTPAIQPAGTDHRQTASRPETSWSQE